MKRFCIYLIYDKEKIIDRYIIHMLKELQAFCDYILVVCNSQSTWCGENAELYADRVIYRDNLGYDAGGFKDALCSCVGLNKISGYDELILANDSFYGPFYPIREVFLSMNGVNADYWGMTRSQKGVTTEGIKYDEHIQSYFLVFRKKVIDSDAFRNFWEQLKYPKTMEEAIRDFELGINDCLKQNGFCDAAITDLYKNIFTIEENKNPYLEYPLELIRDCKIPILKYKALSFGNSGYISAFRALQFLKENNLYDTAYIKNHILRKSKFEKNMIDLEALERFYVEHKRIFIYGYGTYGKNLAFYFGSRGWDLEGFLVTKADKKIKGVTPFERIEIKRDDGIIIAVGRKDVCREIFEYIQNKCAEEQILLPNL